jgi:hypothetical protein
VERTGIVLVGLGALWAVNLTKGTSRDDGRHRGRAGSGRAAMPLHDGAVERRIREKAAPRDQEILDARSQQEDGAGLPNVVQYWSHVDRRP